jgi:hypothetical protein
VTATQLALGLDAPAVDPDALARQCVRTVIESTARLHGGHVSMNDVRDRLAGRDVPSHIRGQVVAALRREGRLVEAGHERSTDTKSGNGGRIIPTYYWVAP